MIKSALAMVLGVVCLVIVSVGQAQIGLAPWQAHYLFSPAACGGSGSTYTGPGDLGIAVTAEVWAGLRAYSRSDANGCIAAIKIIKNFSSSPSQNILLKTTGDLDVASANSFAGTDATCTGTISGTTLSVSSCSGTLQQYDTLTGVGINPPSFILTIGSCASPPGTCTLNQSQTVGSPETITAQTNIEVITAYDRSGALFCGGSACDYTVGALSGPIFLPDCGVGLPCMYIINAPGTVLATPSVTWPVQPDTISYVAERLSGTTRHLVAGFLGSDLRAGFWTGANTVLLGTGATSFTATANDGALHSVQNIFNNTSSSMNIDGSTSTGSASATNPGTGGMRWGADDFGDDFNGIYVNELGLWGGSMGGTDQTNLCHNQRIYWTTAGSC